MNYLISGSIQTGKTTALANWTLGRTDVGGFLSPVVEGTRSILHIKEDRLIPFEVDDSSFKGQTIAVGKYIFDQNAFNLATNWTIQEATEEAISYLIIDEIGKLELKNQGFHDLLSQLLEFPHLNKHMLIVVRKSLLSQVIQKYSLSDFSTIWDLHQLATIGGR